ncbi:biotin transporter BioY [Streptomyces benahoarensis]|uniref:Biotin transporter BioY n=1 Tax=Streptomyces benahoarensis TaxID=2595054 RepID=A0A553ZK20_9ACTN|nr:biotin transporter BioY [Streptomyces benahoarensis]TSB21739.1 biotin transporter BioY [Streptomyces benahoarensis]TSB41763.1 biotin transporter BioY [Streptomyces benahoarensis]
MHSDSARPALTELRLSAFRNHRGVSLPLSPVTLLTGPSGSGKTGALQAYGILARLGAGERLADALASVPGGAPACVPADARPDEQGRRGFRIGCTVDGPAGPVHLDLAVQTEPDLRIAGERLTGGGETLLTTALTDPARRAVQAAWHTAGAAPVTRAPLPDDRLGTSLLPLRVAGKTAGQRLVLAAAEQVVVALRSVFRCDPWPEAIRGERPAPGRAGETDGPGGAADGRTSRGRRVAVRPGTATRTEGHPALGDGADEGRLRSSCDNLSVVLERMAEECTRRHTGLVAAVRAASTGPVEGLRTVPRQPDRRTVADGRSGAEAAPGPMAPRGEPAGPTGIQAVLDRGRLGVMPLDRLGDGELRYLGLAVVLLTGPGVLAMDPVAEIPEALQQLTVVADGADRCMDARQAAELMALAVRMADRGRVRLLGTVRDPAVADGLPGVRVLHLGT